MKEKIILAPGANPTELLRTLSRYGKNTIGVRIMNAVKLAEYLMMKNGISAEGTFVSAQEKPAVYAGFLKNGCGYFRTESYADAVNLAHTVDSARMLLTENEKEEMQDKLSHGEFPEKNSAVLSAYKFYIDYLEKNGACDDITEIRQVISSECRADADFIILDEFPLQPLEIKLIETASGGKYTGLSLCRFAEKEKTPLHIEKYVSAYGALNEAEWILGEILENNIPVDSCTVAVADIPQYSSLFNDLCSVNGIPVTFGCGIPVSGSNPAVLLSLIERLSGTGFFGIDAYSEVLNSPAFDKDRLREKLTGIYYFDRLAETVGNLRISFDKASNDEKISAYEETVSSDEEYEMIKNIRAFAGEMENGPSYLISEYSAIRKGPAAKADISARKAITESLDIYMSYTGNSSFGEVVPQIMAKQVCFENSSEGCLYVTGISSAINTVRENLFVCGMSASSFPGSPKENYLLLDSDCLMFGDKDSVPGSEKAVNDKLNLAKNLVSFASSCGSRIYMSYSSFNLADIKDVNPSSVLFDFFAKEKGGEANVDDFNASLVRTGFFEKNLGTDAGIGRKYKTGSIVSGRDKSDSDEQASYTGERKFSPSDIEKFIECPRKFCLSVIFRLPEEKTDDPFSVIAPNDFGTLVHRIMKESADKKLSVDEVLACGRKEFEDFLKSRPPIHQADAENELDEFLACLENACDMDTGGKPVLTEKKLVAAHPSGITISGIPDRIELLNGRYTVIDYKTGVKVKHVDNDPATCIQTLLYAYMVQESENILVSGCEYRYLRNRNIVRCSYTEATAEAVDRYLAALSGCLDTMNFEISSGKDACRYCSYKKICGINEAEAKK